MLQLDKAFLNLRRKNNDLMYHVFVTKGDENESICWYDFKKMEFGFRSGRNNHKKSIKT